MQSPASHPYQHEIGGQPKQRAKVPLCAAVGERELVFDLKKPRWLRLIASLLFVQRHHANDTVKLVQHIGMAPRQITQNSFVGHEFGEIALGQH